VPSDDLTILVDGRLVPVRLQRHARARGYRLRIDRGGAAKVTMPARGSEKRALDWTRGQAGWIAEQLDRVHGGACLLGDGAVFPLEGVPVTIRWQGDMPRTVRQDGEALLVGGPVELAGERVLRWLKARAKMSLLPPAGAHFEELQDPSLIAKLKAEPPPMLPREDQAGD